MHLTVTDAAKAYNVYRSTIHRAIKSGRISATRRGDGVRVIDLAELVRYWGEPLYPPSEQHRDNTEAAGEQQALGRELRALREEVAALRNELAEQRQLPPPEPTLTEAIRRRLARWIAPD